MNAIVPIPNPPTNIIPFTPKPDEDTIIFLRAFIGTSSPLHRLQVGQDVIAFPMAYPREIRYLMRRYKRSQPCKTDNVIYLPRRNPLPPTHPKPRERQPNRKQYNPEHPLMLKTVPLAGFAQDCQVVAVFHQWFDGSYVGEWATLHTTRGRYNLTKHVPISQIYPK